MKVLLNLLLCTILASVLHADCDFSHAKYIEKMREPFYINQIEVRVPKSAKFNRNFAKILTNNSNYIPNKLKRKFDAKIRVNYAFGSCVYSASIRQNGDLKDHLSFVKGQPVRSLKINLKSGNIVGAVKFKLLIPETRNGKSEILGALFLRQLGFIAPETFAVKTKINNVPSIMLFQEDSQKELLERNLRREGPILEGDEVPLWDEGFRSERQSLALSRVQNDKWLEKGESSLAIGIKAFLDLQAVYLSYFFDDGHKSRDIFSRLMPTKKLNDFYFLMIAMNGTHALSPNNRKFYYDSFNDEFEPIYYDGNLEFKDIDKFDERDLFHFPKDYKFENIQLVKNEIFRKLLKQNYVSRVHSMNERENDFEQIFMTIIKNILALQQEIDARVNLFSSSGENEIKNLAHKYQQQVMQQDYEQRHMIAIEDPAGQYAFQKVNTDPVELDLQT